MEKILLLLFASFFFINCSNEGNPLDIEISREEIREKWDSFIVNWENEDSKACSEFYSINGINIPPELDIKEGRKAIEEFYQFLFDLNISSKYKHTTKKIEILGNKILEVGEFQVDWVSNDSISSQYNARTMILWEKGEKGQWEINKFIFNNPPAK